MRYKAHWGSHIPMLVKAFEASEGPVLELGMGVFSTPLLHWLCLDAGRTLVSYDNDPTYFEMNRTFDSPDHHIHFADNWDTIDIDRHWGLVFVDHHPSQRRGTDARRLADKCDIMVLHDTNESEKHDYDAVYPLFEYRYDWKRAKPYTTVLSKVKFP